VLALKERWRPAGPILLPHFPPEAGKTRRKEQFDVHDGRQFAFYVSRRPAVPDPNHQQLNPGCHWRMLSKQKTRKNPDWAERNKNPKISNIAIR